MAYIPDELADELQRDLSSVMSLYMQGENDTEWYECPFCGATADMKSQEIKHTRECLGVHLLKALDEDRKERMDREGSG